MILYLTSSPFIDGADRAILSPANGLLARLKADLPEHPSCLFICSSPDRRDLTARFGADIFSAFAEAGADIILLPAPGTVPGMTQELVGSLIAHAHSLGCLTLTAIGTSQEGADPDTIRRIALMAKMAGTDIHHLGDTGYGGMALPENIMAYSIAVRGIRHTYHRMADSINR